MQNCRLLSELEMIKIVGGPSANEIRIFNVAEDGSEQEIKDIYSIYFEPILPCGIVKVRIETLAKVNTKSTLAE